MNKFFLRWNDLWLNEGFARYMQFIGTNRVRPTWKMVRLVTWSTFLDVGHS